MYPTGIHTTVRPVLLGRLTRLNLKLDSATTITASVHQQPWRFRDVQPTMAQTQVGIFAQDTREYIGRLGIEKIGD